MSDTLRVLLVEDDAGDARLVRELLADITDRHYVVEHATTLTDAARAAHRTPPSVVLLDLTLPDTRGIATLEAAARRFPSTPIVILTGLDSDETAAESMRFGAQDYLIKSLITSAGLRRAIDHACERHGITAQLRLLLAEKDQINNALRTVTRMKDEFVAIASHELRTPVTIVNGFLETLAGRWSQMDDDQRRSLVATAATNAARLAELTDDLLIVSRNSATASATTGRARAFDVSEAIANAIGRSTIEPGTVAVFGGHIEAFGDPDHVERILRNYLDNARKYGAAPVTVTIREQGEDVEIRVRDHGPGVEDAFVPYLFDRFTQAEDSLRRERAQQGTGLGLAIVKEMAQAMGGDAWYEHGQPGSVFAVRMPRREATNQPTTSEPEVASDVAAGAPAGAHR